MNERKQEMLRLILERVPISLIRDCAMKAKIEDKEWTDFEIEFGLLGRTNPEPKAIYFGRAAYTNAKK